MSVKVYKAALNFRQELQKLYSNTIYSNFWFVGDAVETTFALPIGYKPKEVYDAGSKQKEGSADEYTISFNGFFYSVVFAVAPAITNDVCIKGLRV